MSVETKADTSHERQPSASERKRVIPSTSTNDSSITEWNLVAHYEVPLTWGAAVQTLSSDWSRVSFMMISEISVNDAAMAR